MILSLCLNPSVDTYLWLDRFQAKSANRVIKEERYPGGKGVHVALAASELSEASALIGIWGGESGEWVRGRCEALGIRTFGPSVKEWTRTCLTLRTNDDFNETEILGHGPSVDHSIWQTVLGETRTLAEKSKVICLSGSVPPGVGRGAYAEVIRITGKPVILDCTGALFTEALGAKPFGVHLNRAEAMELGLGEPAEAARTLSSKVSLAAITAGREGLYLGYQGQVLHGSVQLENVKSAVGSGDCLVAGLAVAIARDHSPEDWVRYGVACGAANCLRPELGMLNRSDVERVLPQVKLRGVV